MLVLDGICFLVNFRFAGRETARGSNPRHDQNLIYFDLSKLAQRPLLGRQLLSVYWALERRIALFPTFFPTLLIQGIDCLRPIFISKILHKKVNEGADLR